MNNIFTLARLRVNWYLPLSALAFFCLCSTGTPGYAFGYPFVLVLAAAVGAAMPNLWQYVKKPPLPMGVLALLSALGACLYYFTSVRAEIAYDLLAKSHPLLAALPAGLQLPPVALLCAMGLPFIFLFLLTVYDRLWGSLQSTGLLQSLTKAEWLVYALLGLGALGAMALIFLQTDIFYGTPHLVDTVYTCDGPSLVKGNAYMNLTHPENDIRQPLFALFSMPFVGIPYLAARLVLPYPAVLAVAMNAPQILLFLLANLMLASMLQLTGGKRISFMLLCSCTYMGLLFPLMMEQYMVSYFWLVFCVYLIAETGRTSPLAMYATGGTLLTGMILMPFLSARHPIREFRAWFRDMLCYGFGFGLLILLCCRVDILFILLESADMYTSFTGEALTFMDKVNQYTHFVRNCFLAPAAAVTTTIYPYPSWQMLPITGVQPVGIVLLGLCALSAFLHRNRRDSLLAFGWVLFSLVMLLLLGWGTQENGLILYALYFGWAFFLLLFRLVLWAEERLRLPLLTYGVGIATAALLLAKNIPALLAMLQYGLTYYPV